MGTRPFSETLRLCVVADRDRLFEEAEKNAQEMPHLSFYSLAGIVDFAGNTTDLLDTIEQNASNADAVLVEWDFNHAPLIGILSYRIRSVPAPLIALTTKKLRDRIAALMVGADRVHTLPISMSLLRVQVLAHLRTLRTSGLSRRGWDLPVGQALMSMPEQRLSAHQLRYGPLTLDAEQFRFYIRDEIIPLTPRQYALLKLLIRNQADIVTRDEILDCVWGVNFHGSTNLIDVYIHFIRKILRGHDAGVVIETVRGVGFRLGDLE